MRIRTGLPRLYAVFRLCLPAVLVLAGCSSHPDGNQPASPEPDISETLGPDAGALDMALHMLAARRSARTTHALPAHYPDLDRETGYAVQRLALDVELDEGAGLIGWKMGGTRITDPAASPDPIYGYSTTKNLFTEDVPIPDSHFVGGEPMVEPEITLWIGKDIPGPNATREQVVAAIESVAAGCEIVSPRNRAAGDLEPSQAHILADNVAHGGSILSPLRVPITGFDFDGETAQIFINGELRATGSGAPIMGATGDPIDAVVALANELSQRGLLLKAGQFVMTGSMVDNPTMKAGDTAELRFSTLGTIRLSLSHAPTAGH